MFGWLDYIVIVVYFAVSLGVGFWAGRKERDTKDFFLGGRRQHWLLAGISIVATEVSAILFIAVPGDAFKSDWSYLQMYVGSFLGRVLIVYLLLPAFYGGAVTTVYEYLGQRFGPWTRTTATLMFFASRIFGSGIRLLVASLALAEVFQLPLSWVVVAATGAATAYATFGGIKAILWTDAFQASVFAGCAVLAIVLLFSFTPGSWTENLSTAYDGGKFHVFTFDGGLNHEKYFWLLAIFGLFTTMAAMGTDQDLTQRMLTCPNLRAGQRSLLFNAFMTFPLVVTFLLIGSLLHLYYASPAASPLPVHVQQRMELVFPYFMATSLPVNTGLKGLMVTAILAAAMGSLSSAIGALASTAVTDLYRPFQREKRDEKHYLAVARASTLFFGVLLIVMALAFANEKDLLWAVFKWVGLVFGGMLGVFLLGVATKTRGLDGANAAAMLSSTGILIALNLFQEKSGDVFIAWPWWIVIGTVWTFAWGMMFRTRKCDG